MDRIVDTSTLLKLVYDFVLKLRIAVSWISLLSHFKYVLKHLQPSLLFLNERDATSNLGLRIALVSVV